MKRKDKIRKQKELEDNVINHPNLNKKANCKEI